MFGKGKRGDIGQRKKNRVGHEGRLESVFRRKPNKRKGMNVREKLAPGVGGFAVVTKRKGTGGREEKG